LAGEIVPKPIRQLNLFRQHALEAADLKDAAIAAYQVVIDGFPQAMEAGIAKNRIKVLRPDPKAPAQPPYNPNKIVPRG